MTAGSQPPKPDPSFVFGVALVASLLLWLPAMTATLAGRIGVTASALRYLVGLAFAWLGVWVLATVWVRYEHTPRAAVSRPAAPRPTPTIDTPRRRSDDEIDDATGLTEPRAESGT